MDFIFDNIKILIFVGAGVLWVIGKMAEKKKRQQEEQQQPWSPPYEDDGYEEPAPQHQWPQRPMVPPPLPRAVVPPVRPPPVPASDDRELARQRVMQERLAALKQERTAVAKAVKKPVRAKGQPMVSPSSVKGRLGDRRELRKAIIMREILDPPVGLR